MDTIKKLLKQKIAESSERVIKLIEDLEFIKAGLDYSNKERVDFYQELHEDYHKETSKLRSLRAALVNVLHAEQTFDINTFHPEDYV